MYRKLSLFFVVALLVLVSGCTTTLPRALPSEATTGSLDISSIPQGSEIYVDGVYKGTTPKILSDVPAGSHILELRYAGYTSLKKSVEIKAGTLSYVDASLSPIVVPPPLPTTVPTTIPTTKPTPVPALKKHPGMSSLQTSNGLPARRLLISSLQRSRRSTCSSPKFLKKA